MEAIDKNQDLAIPSEHASKPPRRQSPTVAAPRTPSCSVTCEVLAGEQLAAKAMFCCSRAHSVDVNQETWHATETDPNGLV